MLDLRNKIQDEILLNKENINEYQDSNNLIYDNNQSLIEESFKNDKKLNKKAY